MQRVKDRPRSHDRDSRPSRSVGRGLGGASRLQLPLKRAAGADFYRKWCSFGPNPWKNRLRRISNLQTPPKLPYTHALVTYQSESHIPLIHTNNRPSPSRDDRYINRLPKLWCQLRPLHTLDTHEARSELGRSVGDGPTDRPSSWAQILHAATLELGAAQCLQNQWFSERGNLLFVTCV